MSGEPARTVALSIVVPIHDELENLGPLVAELVEVLGARAERFEIVLVDDASEDGSRARIRELAANDPRVRAVYLRRRGGQTAALDAGFKAAAGRFVVTMDGDLQNDPRDIPRLLAALDDHDAAVGYRVERADPWSKRLAARLANSIRNRCTGDDVIDTGCSLKAFRREPLAALRLYEGLHRFLPTLMRIEGFRVVQLPVGHRPRRSGRSKYGIFGRLIRTIPDLWAVRWMKRRRLDYELDEDI